MPAKPSERRHPPPPAVIIAGGRSSRMGIAKAGLILGGRPMLDRIVARLAPQVASLALNLNAEPATALSADLPVIADTIPGFFGPLAGILTAMRHVQRTAPNAMHVLTVPTDTPFFPSELAAGLANALTSGEEIAVASSDGALSVSEMPWNEPLPEHLPSEPISTVSPTRKLICMILFSVPGGIDPGAIPPMSA